MTRFPRRKRDSKSANNLVTKREIYLRTLSENAPDSTFLSHQTVLREFGEWSSANEIDEGTLQEKNLTRFVEYLLRGCNLNITTVCGNIYSLSNFIGYLYQEDPEVVRYSIASHLQQSSSSDLRTVGKRVTSAFKTDEGIDEKGPAVVEVLLSYLRHRKFGTRLHAFVELIQATKSRPNQVRQLNLSNIDIERESVTIKVPERHIVSSTGLFTDRVVELSRPTTDAVETYINYERKEVTEKDCGPVFTTAHGRASGSTLRRSTKQASETAMRQPPFWNGCKRNRSRVQESMRPHQTVTPEKIWKHAITTTRHQ